MAVVAHALTTLTRVKSRLNIVVTTFDTVLEELINSMTDWVENFCDRRFKETVYSNEVYDGGNLDGLRKKWLILKNCPVIGSLTAFSYMAGVPSTPYWTAFLRDDYDLNNDSGVIKLFSVLPNGFRNIRVSYTAGYKIDFTAPTDPVKHTLPFDISNVVERLVIKEFKRREAVGREQEAVGDSSITWRDGLEKEDLEVLERYKRTIFV